MKHIIKIIKHLLKATFYILLYCFASYSILTIIEYWFLLRFVHIGHFLDAALPKDSLEYFLRLRNQMNNEQCIKYIWFLFLITIVNYIFILLKMRNYRTIKNGKITFLGKYFSWILLIILNLRFWGDTLNDNVNKYEWYYIFEAIPSYFMFSIFSIYSLLLLNGKNRFCRQCLKEIHLKMSTTSGRLFLFILFTYGIYTIIGFSFLNIYRGEESNHAINVYRKYFATLNEPISKTISELFFDNWKVIAVNIGTLCISIFTFCFLTKTYKSKYNPFQKVRFLLIDRVLTFLLIIASTMERWKQLINIDPLSTEGIESMALYVPLMLTCILFLLATNKKEIIVAQIRN